MKLSIITINFNNSLGLEKTIRSVISQTFCDFEYIIIDGNSTDGSVDIIIRYSDKINYWISESDSGIYNAMNKGIRQAKGEYILFLNSGDSFKNHESIEYSQFYLFSQDIIYCNLCLVFERSCTVKIYPDKLSMKYFLDDALPHPASFIRRTLFDKYGYYDESYKIVSDWVFFFNVIVLKDGTYKHVNKSISLFTVDGISSNMDNYKTILSEKRHFYNEELPFTRKISRYIVICCQYFKNVCRKVLLNN